MVRTGAVTSEGVQTRQEQRSCGSAAIARDASRRGIEVEPRLGEHGMTRHRPGRSGVPGAPPPPGLKERGGGGASGTQKFVYQKWPDQIFPMVNFCFFPQGSLPLVGGGGSRGGGGLFLGSSAVLM